MIILNISGIIFLGDLKNWSRENARPSYSKIIEKRSKREEGKNRKKGEYFKSLNIKKKRPNYKQYILKE